MIRAGIAFIISAALGLVLLLSAGCGLTLPRAHAALDYAATTGIRAVSLGCQAEADKCRASGASQPSCPGWIACDATRAKINAAARTGEDGLLALQQALDYAKTKGWLK